MNTLTVIFALYLVVLIGIGIVANRRSQGGEFLSQFFVAGRRLGPVVIGLTVISSFASGGALIATPGLVYSMGLAAVLWQSAGFAYGFVTVAAVGRRLAQLARQQGAISLPDLFRRRYGDSTALVATVLIIGLTLPYMGAQYIGVARIMQALMGIDYTVAIAISAAVILTYVSLGGMLAQAWTNVLQCLLMIAAVVIGGIGVMTHLGSFQPMTEALAARGPEFLGPPGPKNWLPLGFALSMGAMLVGFGAFGAPHVVTRFYALRNTRDFSKAFLVAGLAASIWFPILLIIGMGSVAMFPTLSHSDLAFPSVAVQLFHPIIGGLILAGIAAAMMSTVDAMLMTVGVSVTRDLYQRFLPNTTQRTLRMVNLGVTALAAVLSVLIALKPPPFLMQLVLLALAGMAASFAIPLFAALYWPRATTAGALTSMLVGFAITYLFHQKAILHPLGFHAVGWALAASFLCMWLVSLVTRPAELNVLQAFYGTVTSPEALSGSADD